MRRLVVVDHMQGKLIVFWVREGKREIDRFREREGVRERARLVKDLRVRK